VNKRRERKYIGKGVPSPGLFGLTPKCKGPISCIGHGHEHPFRCFIFEQTECTQQGVWASFHGWSTNRWETHKTQRCLHTLCAILWFVVVSVAEAELGALFLNFQEGTFLKLTLEDLGHKQPTIPVHCNNATAVGIANNTIKWQRLRAMEMRYFWTCKKDAQNVYSFQWHPGTENLADYQSKNHPGTHHTAVRPYYLHEKNSPGELPRVNQPSTLKGCVGTLKDGYVRNVPLPRVPHR
jgi:hypothetical protein